MSPRALEYDRRAGLVGVLLACGIALHAGHADGQLVDQGRLRITVNGSVVGTEEFAIQRTGTGNAQVTLAKGTITMTDGRSIETLLRVTGPTLVVNDYQAKVDGEGQRAVVVARIGNRLQARTTAPWGEELREYRAQASTILLDDAVAHHYFVLSRLIQAPPQALHAVVPLLETESTISGVAVAPDSVTIDGERVSATRIQLGSGPTARVAWFDGGGRLVRVEIPSKGFVAERRMDG